jgi:hypothetical protein
MHENSPPPPTARIAAAAHEKFAVAHEKFAVAHACPLEACWRRHSVVACGEEGAPRWRCERITAARCEEAQCCAPLSLLQEGVAGVWNWRKA